MMKRIIFIVLFLFSWVLSFEQTRPNTFTEETSPTNANFEVYSQKNNLPRRASLNNLKAFFDQYIYTKTDSICISRQAGDTCVYFVPTDIDSIGMSNDTIILYGGGDEIADLPVSRIEAIIEIGSGNITNGSVSTVDLADGSVNSAKIADGSVTTGDILDGTIATADLADALITLAKLAANSIDSTKVINGGLSGADLADAAILTAKIADGQVTGDKIASNTIPLGDLTQISSNVLLGRYSSGIGDVQQISIGSGLSLSGSTLTATGVAANVVDSMRIQRAGDVITVFLYSGATLVTSKNFTDNYTDSLRITKVDSTVTVYLYSGGSLVTSKSFIDSQGSGGGGASELNDLSDVTLSSEQNGQVLVYDSGDSRYENRSNYYPFNRNTISYDGMSIDVRYLGSTVPSMSGTAASGYTMTVASGVELQSASVTAGASNLNGSGDFDFSIVTTWDGTESSEFKTMPTLLGAGFFIGNWDAYGVTGYFNNSAPGDVQYVISNLGGFGGGGFTLYFKL